MPLDTTAVTRELLANRFRVLAVAAMVLREHHLADDVFQQVVMKAIENPAQFKDAGHLLAWALRTARHRAIDAARGRREQRLDEGVYELLEAHVAELPSRHFTDRRDALQKCLDGLPTAAKKILRLRYDDELSCGQIAGKLGQSLDAVYQRLSRLHRALRDCVDRRVGTEASR